MILSVVIPVYNERATIRELVRRVRAAEAGLPKEIIVVDDGSTDGTREALKALAIQDRCCDSVSAPKAPAIRDRDCDSVPAPKAPAIRDRDCDSVPAPKAPAIRDRGCDSVSAPKAPAIRDRGCDSVSAPKAPAIRDRDCDSVPAPDLRVLFHDRNRGKGAALRTGFAAATGDIVLVQDADLEYDPAEYPRLLGPILDGRADVVYGSRFLGGPHRVLFFWHYVGNRILTTLCNLVSNINLTDMETCYKAFRREILDRIRLKSNRFGFEPEVTVKVAKLRCRIYEVPISYSGRDYAEGKKIGWRDGLAALFHIIRFRFFD